MREKKKCAEKEKFSSHEEVKSTTPPSVNFSSQPVVRGPKVSHHSCYCVILHCIAQIDKPTLHGVLFCKQSRYYIICSLVNTVDKIIFFPFKSIEEKRCSLL